MVCYRCWSRGSSPLLLRPACCHRLVRAGCRAPVVASSRASLHHPTAAPELLPAGQAPQPELSLFCSTGHSSMVGAAGWMKKRKEEGIEEDGRRREKEECFADVATSDSLSTLFKVRTTSDKVFMADLRRLSGDGFGVEPWVCIGDGKRAVAAATFGRKDGNGYRIEWYHNWVFVVRGADVEVWTLVELAPEAGGKKVMGRNWVGNGPSTVR